ncbi:MAG: adenine phosphoribosyltransferase [Candidatus Aenigmatarchaeota archaeon]
MENSVEMFKNKIRRIPDWPKKGIIFLDITPLLNDEKCFQEIINILYERYKDKKINKVVGIESRGFIIGSALAYKLSAGFVPIRKFGKLPWKKITEEYELEYGKDKIEMHKDAISENDNVILIDDLIATGGTAKAAANLIKKLGGKIIECCFLIELKSLSGRKVLEENGYKVFSLIQE